MKKIITTIGILLWAMFIFAQTAPTIEWEKTFGEKAKNENAYKIIETESNNLIIYGSVTKTMFNMPWIITTDAFGNIQGNVVPKQVYIQQFADMTKTKDNNYVATGIANSTNYGESDANLIKFSSTLSTLWNKKYNAAPNDLPTAVAPTSDGGVIMAASASSENSENVDISLIKINAQGGMQWKKSFGGDSIDFPVDVLQTDDKGYIIAAYSNSFSESSQFYLIKTDSHGNKQWEKTYPSMTADQTVAIIPAKAGGFIVVGNSYGGMNWENITAIKISKQGNLMWRKDYGGSRNDEVSDIIADPDGGYIIAGSTKSYGNGGWDYWIFKIDEAGNMQWDKTFGHAFDDKANSITTTFDGGLAVVGYRKQGRKDIWLIKLKFSIRERAKAFVQTHLTEWETKGKFEKLADYQKRVNENTRRLKVEQLLDEFFGKIGEPIFAKDLKSATLDYDTESEVFRLNTTYFNPIYIPVPIKEAEKFDANLSKLQYKNIKFRLTPDDKLEISQMTIKNPANGKTYFFDASKPVVFDNQTEVTEFEPIEILPDDNTDNNNALSDVDTDIPNTGKTYPNRYALIIGNGHYIEHGSDMVNIKYSINDAKIFRKYAVNVLGIPDDGNHIYYIEDANATYIKLYIDNFAKLIENQPDNSEFFVFYSGHGSQNENNEAFIVPVGVTSDYIDQFGIKLSDFYKQISPTGNKKVFVFLDACFSGGGKDGQLLINAKAGVRRTPKNNSVATNLVIFAASSENQISQEYLDKKHGIFTYFLLKNLKDSKGNLTFGQLADKIKQDITATTLNPQNKLKQQTPNVNVSPSIKDKWRDWKVLP